MQVFANQETHGHETNGTGTQEASPENEGRAYGFFSSHQLSFDQVEEIQNRTGKEMSDIENLSDLADRHIDSHQKIDRVWSDLQERIQEMLAESDVAVVFGVFPPPIRAKLHQWSTGESDDNLILYESFNSRQPTSGRGPNFEHIQWVETGRYDLKFPAKA